MLATYQTLYSHGLAFVSFFCSSEALQMGSLKWSYTFICRRDVQKFISIYDHGNRFYSFFGAIKWWIYTYTASLCSLFWFLFLPLQKELPLRLYYGYGPRIHRQLSIEYGVANKRCENCGEVGQLTCFSGSFRKWVCKVCMYSS